LRRERSERRMEKHLPGRVRGLEEVDSTSGSGRRCLHRQRKVRTPQGSEPGNAWAG
jgi:hypothetical protein